ncbi:cytochrome P450 [Streptomyces sp. SL13]|uniref:Cytochrome P450 n=1 Tax=Streptantibioticus silvisoli TaxID=2705255 RepID=A0AA90H345_9ACTN|nr:cytochrome P450 [Streptantibioticus silvisoli]MDI5964865.1 cytochrome P450 [Streptantibioticus silvisoli]MDI5971136.1 cytochrome P450 [Streptantibioticus silvisoli]
MQPERGGVVVVMRSLGSRVASWMGRRYLAKAKGLDLSELALFPSAALMPLRRDGLDPVPELGKLREEAPVSKLVLPFGVNVWLVTGYEPVKQVLGDAKAFSNDFSNIMGRAGTEDSRNPGGLGFADPPVHTRLRKLLTPEFTMRRLARLTPGIESIVRERLDAMEAAAAGGRPVDLVAEFALPIPSLVICELLGVPYGDREEFQHLSMARFDLFGGAGASFGSISKSLEYLLEVVRRQRTDPGDGLIGQIIKEHGDEIEDEELAGLADGVLTGGFETTASMIALGGLVLLQDPVAFGRVADGGEAAVSDFVEELLRHLTVVQVAFPRFARQDVVIGGVPIGKGDVVVTSLSAADRDSVLGPGMDVIDSHRAATSHLAFGHGLHRCIGAQLARMELRAAYPALVHRFPGMRLAVPPQELIFRKSSIVYGVESLPVRLS